MFITGHGHQPTVIEADVKRYHIGREGGVRNSYIHEAELGTKYLSWKLGEIV
jgi:hypothetical protein